MKITKIYEIMSQHVWKDIDGKTCKSDKYHWSGFFSSKKKAIAEIEHHLGWLQATNKTNKVSHYDKTKNFASYEYNETTTLLWIDKHYLF